MDKGFRMSGLIIVAVVTGILAAIVIPQYKNAGTNARATIVISDTRVILNAAQVFYSQNGYYPESGFLLEGFNMNKHYEDWDIRYSFENCRNTDGNAEENSEWARLVGAWTSISVFSEDQKLIDAILGIAPGYVVPLDGFYGYKRVAVILEPYIPNRLSNSYPSID